MVDISFALLVFMGELHALLLLVLFLSRNISFILGYGRERGCERDVLIHDAVNTVLSGHCHCFFLLIFPCVQMLIHNVLAGVVGCAHPRQAVPRHVHGAEVPGNLLQQLRRHMGPVCPAVLLHIPEWRTARDSTIAARRWLTGLLQSQGETVVALVGNMDGLRLLISWGRPVLQGLSGAALPTCPGLVERLHAAVASPPPPAVVPPACPLRPLVPQSLCGRPVWTLLYPATI